MDKTNWRLYPVYGNKNWLKVGKDTELINFSLFCPKCKQESLVNICQL